MERKKKQVRFREPTEADFHPAPSKPVVETKSILRNPHSERGRKSDREKRGRTLRLRSRTNGECNRRKYAVRIHVNVRYRGDRNGALLLRRDLRIVVCARDDLWEVWKSAKKKERCLTRLKVCRKVVAYGGGKTDVIAEGRVKDVFKDGQWRWIFIVEKPLSLF